MKYILIILGFLLVLLRLPFSILELLFGLTVDYWIELILEKLHTPNRTKIHLVQPNLLAISPTSELEN